MAAKISAELKACVKALRDECKVFIDLRSSTEEECFAYIAKHESKPVQIKQAPLVQPEYPSCDVLEGVWNEGVCLLQKDLVAEAPRDIAAEIVAEAKTTDTYWLSWNEAYTCAVDTLTVPVQEEDYAQYFTLSDLSALVTDVIEAISKNLVKALRSIWGAVPQQYRVLGKAFLQRRKNEIFARCNSFKEMVKASKLISKLTAPDYKLFTKYLRRIMSQQLITNPAMNECQLIGEEVDIRVGDNVEVRYYFGRPFSKSDYVILKTVYKPIVKQDEQDVNEVCPQDENIPF